MNDNKITGLQCSVVRVLYAKEQFAICQCKTKGKIPSGAISDFGNDGYIIFTALGEGMPVNPKQPVLLSGSWESSKKSKFLQLRISACEDYIGDSRHEIVSYLSSSILKGIGKKTAERIFDAFGKDSIKVIENEPEKLLEIPGIKKKKMENIITSFEAHRDLHNLTLLLAKYNVSYRSIVNIRRTLGKNATRRIRENPYCLCHVRGFGFKTTDTLAMEMGEFADSKFRIQGAVNYVLDNAQTQGHVYLPLSQLLSECCNDSVLNQRSLKANISKARVHDVVCEMLTSGLLKSVRLPSLEEGGEEAIYKSTAYIHETFAAQKVAEKLRMLKLPETDWETLVAESEQHLGVSLDEKQAKAAIMALSNPLSVITGGPGTGKTTSLRVIVLTYLLLYPKRKIALAAPTGRAARRMHEQTHMPAQTIHKLLGLKPDTWTNFSTAPAPEEEVQADLLIIDESSMIDAQLFAELMYRIPKHTQVIFLGDADQLPSVGAGNVLSQLLQTDLIPSVKLEKVFRQAEDSIIPVNAAKIRQGIQDLEYNRYFRFVSCESEEAGANVIKQLVQRSVNKGMFSISQILCPMKSRGAVCTRELNNLLHDIVNPPSENKKEAMVAGVLFREGDKVMQTRNIEGVSNGDIGYIMNILGNANDQETFSLIVKFDACPDLVTFTYEEALDLTPALAITIHKSQGSEFEAVIVPIFKSMSFFLRRNLLYTAITRAKKQVVIVSDGNSIGTAIYKEDTSKRNTLLSHFISHT